MIAIMLLAGSLAFGGSLPAAAPATIPTATREVSAALVAQSPQQANSDAPTAILGSAAPPAQTVSGLPARAPDPRTLREFWQVFLGFAAAWVAIVGYIVGTANRRIGRIATTLEAVERDVVL